MVATATKPNGRNAQDQDDSLMDQVLDQTQRESETMQMLRMENETMMTAAKMTPRNFERIKQDLKDLVDSFPDFARQAIYEKPCGSDGDGGRQKIARGLSVRAAEAFAEIYGYNRVVADVIPIDEFTIKIIASFTDFQRMRTYHDSGIVSRRYKQSKYKGGGVGVIPEDRFYNVTVKAEKSRYIREVVNRSVNAALKAWFFDYCDEKVAEFMDETAINKMLATFLHEFGVTEDMVENYIGRPRRMQWTRDDRVRLAGVYNALKEQETTVQEAFGVEEKPAATGRVVKAKDLNAQPEIDTATTFADKVEPATEAIDSKAVMKEINDALNAANAVGTVQDVKKRFAADPRVTDEQAAWLEEEANRKIEDIRASRGDRAK